MELFWGAVLTLISALAWIGQVIYTLSPELATRLQLGESRSGVDRVFYFDARGEAAWDAMILWTLPVAGILVMHGSPLWVYFGLVGSGCYLYFAGRNITTRLIMQKQGIRIGTASNIVLGYLFCVLWGAMAVITIFVAVSTLVGR